MTNFLLTGVVMSGLVLSTSCNQSAVQSQSFASSNYLAHYSTMVTDTATFGSGCFWCTEAVFQQLDGVLKVTSGYSGGHIANPTYDQVCSKATGHAEVVQIIYDQEKIGFDDLLEVFWKTHDPTTLNKQGNDVGPQYRSVIFYHNEMQRKLAEHYKEKLNQTEAFPDPVITEISPFKSFYVAEDYHQNFYSNNPTYGYCSYVIKPKLDKFEKVFKDKLRKSSLDK